MQKPQIHNFVFDSLHSSPFDGPLHLRKTSDQKIEMDKKCLQFNFREGLFLHKCRIPKFLFNTLWSSMLGVP